MKIFAGPPGTGKTWGAAREAVRTLVPGIKDADISETHQKLVEEGKIIWVTFHPSFTYEDFVEGFRPEETPTGGISYSIIPGPFLRACRTASAAVSANRFHVGQKIGDYEVRHVEAGGVVLYSETTRKDAVTPGSVGFVDFWTLKQFEKEGLGPDALRIPGAQNERKQEVARKLGLPTTFFANSSRHAAVYEYLKTNGVAATGTPVVLVIDEINRADLSRVFGELITLLEFDKRQGAAEERQVSLTYSQRKFAVPAELSIIGTMNTADRSLSSVDLALRRRFEFIFVPPDPSLAPSSYGGVNVRAFFQAMNERLALLGGSETLIGHADFMAGKLDAFGARENFDSDDHGGLQALALTLRTKTVPYLADLFRADWNRVRLVTAPALFEKATIPADIDDELAELVMAEEAGLWQMADWWDPTSPKWDPPRFIKALGKYAAGAPAGTVPASGEEQASHSSGTVASSAS